MASGAGPARGDDGGGRPALPAGASPDQRAVEQWLRFALAQEGRVAPHLDPASLQTAGSRGAYRLALRHLDGLPLFATDDRCFDVRLGVSLWDRATGCFFGNTAHSTPVSYDMRRSKGKRGFHLHLDFNLYLHTRAALGSRSDGSSSCGSGGSSGTCGSMGVGAGGGATAPKGGSGGALAAVVEVILVERGEDGVTLNEFSAGWAMVPLFGDGCSSAGGCSDAQPARAGPGIISPGSPSKAALGIATSSKPSCAARGGLRLGSCLGCAAAPASPAPAGGPLSPLQSGALAARLGAGASMSVPVFVGSPRWLVLRQASPPGTCEAPPQLLADGAECRLHFQFEAYPEAEAWAPLVPDNFLLSCRDVVPGVQRLGANAMTNAEPAPTRAFLSIASQLEPPQLCGVRAVVLSGLRLHLPDGFVEVARQHAAAVWRRAHAGGAAAGGAWGAAAGAGRLLPLADLQHRLSLRVSVHNGRRFVGPPAVCQAAALEPAQGRRGEHELLLAQPAPLAWLPADRHVMLVLELLLHTEPPASSRGAPASPAAAPAELDGAAGVTVMGWTAVSPFTWRAGSLEPAMAAGQQQAALRSGPGRWLRHTPVLDWRRLLERTNRLSPEAPTISFRLAEAPGQALWPPPASPVPLQPVLPVHQPVASGVGRQAQLSTTPSEAETLVSVRAAPVRQKEPAPAAGTFDLAARAGGKPIAAPAEVQAWRISARYDAAGSGASEQQQQQQQQQQQGPESLPVLPSIRTRLPLSAPAVDGSDAEALYAGSPTKGRGVAAGQLGRAAGVPVSVVEAAAAALPAEAHVQRDISLAAELDDPLATSEASLQIIAFEAELGQGGGCSCSSGGCRSAQQQLPSRLHFTYRSLTGPAVTPSLRLELAAGGAGSPGPGGRQLFGLVADESGPSSGACDAAVQAPVHRLQLLDAAGLLQLVSAEGLPPAAAASLARQHRLRAARWLSQGRLQVDVWDSASLLQVGTASLPLRGLLRQGRPSTELLLRVPVADPHRAIARLDASGNAPQLCCSPIRGSLIVRLACAGTRLDLQAACASQLPAGSCSWPASPLKQQGTSDGTVVVRAKPALEEGGPLARELARLEGVPESTAPDRLAAEVVGRAAAKVQRLLHYRSLPAAARRRSGSSTGAGLGSGAAGEGPGSVATGPAAGCCPSGTSEAGLELERRLLGEVEAARERCKRDAILARLQAELPSCQALCIAPGETAAFEYEFANRSSWPGWFEIDLGDSMHSSSRSRSRSQAAATLSFVSGEGEWQALESTARLAGLCHGDAPGPASAQLRAVYSSRFQLAAHERCLLRLKLSSRLGDGQAAESEAGPGSQLSWHEVAIRPAGSSTAQAATDASTAAVRAVATVHVGVQRLAAPAVYRTLRIYCPAGSSVSGSEAAVVHAVDLQQLPGASRLLAGPGGQPAAFVSSSPAARVALQGRRLLLSCAAGEVGSTRRFFVAARSGGSCGSSSGSNSSSSTMPAECPSEVWEVFVHTLPTVCLSAGVGTAATASCLVAQEAAPTSTGAGALQAQGLSLSWRGCRAAELAASLGSGPSTATSAVGRSSRLVLSYEPAAVSRRELLLSVVASGGSQRSEPGGTGSQQGAAAPQGGQKGGQLVTGRPRQVELLLVQLDSSGTRFSRTFEVDVPPGQAVSKKVRYSSPHPQPRRFALRSLQPELLRPAPKWQRAAGGVLLQPGEEASIRLAFEGSYAAWRGSNSGGEGQQCEAVAVLESSTASGSGPWQAEEVFRVLLKAA